MLTTRRTVRYWLAGFTLIEIVLVVMLIMILAALVGPNLISQAATAKTTKIEMATVKGALANFEGEVGRLPTTQEGLDALLKRPPAIATERYSGRFLEDAPVDAWNNEFRYRQPGSDGREYDLISAGPDQTFDTPDDITSVREPRRRAETASSGD